MEGLKDEGTGRTTAARSISWRETLGVVVVCTLVLGLVGSMLAVTASTRAEADAWGGPQARQARLRERMTRAAGWALRSVDASALQQQRVEVILGDSLEELSALHAEHARNREEMLSALQREEIDRDEIEAIRVAEMQLADFASRTLLGAVADAASELTPEQRTRLSRHALRHWESRHRRHHG